jgi:AAA domain
MKLLTSNGSIRLATVDNFQGEEAKVMIVSFVRSNNSTAVGFLKTTNCTNMLLSHAQHGDIPHGNADTYSNAPMWDQILTMLRSIKSVGRSLVLCCPRHPQMEIKVSELEDFAAHSPEGGCKLTCGQPLPECQHICPSICHSESMHQVFCCTERCERKHPIYGHACTKPTCGENCGDCYVELDNILLPCGHSQVLHDSGR